MQTAAGGPIYEEDWSDRWEPYAAKIGLAGDVIGLGTAATGVGIPVGTAIAGFANIPNLIIDGYQTARDTWRSFNDNGNSLGSAAWNGGELILDAAGLKALQYINKAAKAGVAPEKYLTSTEKALDSKPWKRVGTGHGRVRARQRADHKRKYNSRRNKALEESNIELAKRGVRPAQGLYYQQKLTDEMAKRGYGVAVNDAIKSANRTLRQNLGIINGVSGGTNLYHIFKKEKGGMLEFLKNGSGIHIKEKNKGKFTSYCGGKVTDECIQKGKNSSNPAIRKRATFADNARRWKHKSGGIIKAQEGTKFSWQSALTNMGTNLFNSYLQSRVQNNKINSEAEVAKAENEVDLNQYFWDTYQQELAKAQQEEEQKNKAISAMNDTVINSSPLVTQKIAYDKASKSYGNQKANQDARNKAIDEQAKAAKSSVITDAVSGVIQNGLGMLKDYYGSKNNNSTSSSTNSNSYFDNYINTKYKKFGTFNSDGSMNMLGGTFTIKDGYKPNQPQLFNYQPLKLNV